LEILAAFKCVPCNKLVRLVSDFACS